MSILDTFPHLATAYVRTRTADAIGGFTDSYTTVFADRACWLQSVRDAEIIEFQKRGMDVTAKVYFRTNPSLDERHTLKISDVTYDVASRSIPDSSAGMGVVWRVMVSASTTEGTDL